MTFARLSSRLGPTLEALRRRAPLVVTATAVIAWGAFLVTMADFRWGGEIRTYVCLGDEFYHPAALDDVPRVGVSGYDGQYYAALATDPLFFKNDTSKALDAPSYRARRVMISFLAWVLALGMPVSAVYLYQLLCWGLAALAVYLVARWLADDGHSPWWAYLLAVGAGMATSVLRTTPDPGALALVLLALWLHRDGRFPLALVTACAAVMARETSYLVAVAIAIAEARQRRFVRAAAFLLLPVALFSLWQLNLMRLFHGSFMEGGGNFSVPFIWLGHKVASAFGAAHGVRWAEVVGLLAILASCVATLLPLTRPSSLSAPELTLVLFGVMGIFLSYAVYVEVWAYSRVLIVVPFLALLVAERQDRAWRRWALRSVPILYAVIGLLVVVGEVRYALADHAPRPIKRVAAQLSGSPAPAPQAPVRP